MSALYATSPPTAQAEVRAMLRELQEETILLVLPALYVVSFPLLVLAPRLPNPSLATEPCLLAFWLGVAVVALRRASYRASAWALVLGCIAVDLLVVNQVPVRAAISLLALPAGLAALLIGVPAGVLTALACTALLICSPPGLVAAGGELRAMTLFGIWGTVALVWLTTRPLLTTAQWSWSSYQQSRGLLEQARDQRLQLKQAVADLAEANLQLTRLNRLADSLRQAAEDARRAKEQFVANVSHELRTPLNMVIGFSETILQAPETYGEIPPALLADLTVIHRNSQHLSDLIDDVLDLSQIEAAQMALAKEHASLGEIIEAAAVAVRPLFASKGLYLEAEVPADLPAVFCDRTRVREVLLNLLSNAGRFTEHGGVRIRAWGEPGAVVVSVADTGPGIDPRDKERLFRPFEQLDGSLRRRYGGTGLGLAISKSFVELHGGRMWLESELGRGTTFYFRLPIEPPAPIESGVSQWLRSEWEYEQRPRRHQSPPPVVHPRFVVLESGNSLQRLLARYMDQAEVVPATSLERALAELARVPAQALIVNEASVGEALQRLAPAVQSADGAPLIICSVPGAHEAAGSLGVADYLVKPVPRDTLLATLDRLDLDGKAVLVVDDDPEAARLFRRMLNSFGRGYRVLTTSDGRQALEILRDQRPDALLLDLIMPDMDGFQLLVVKNADPAVRDIPVVVISASDPAGQPIVASAVAVTRGGGLSMPQLLACIEAVSGSFSPAGQPGHRGLPTGPPG